MVALAVRNLLHAAPFVPFTVYVADGRAIRVRHPDFATLTQGGGLLIVNTGEDDFEIINVSLITRLESTEAPAPA